MNARAALFCASLSFGCACALVAGRAAPASAEATREAVSLNVPDCLDVRGDDVKPLVALELAPRLRVAAADEPPAEIVASVHCAPGVPVTMTVDDPARTAPLRVELDLERAAPTARTRLLALSLAELIATSVLERGPRVREEPPPASAEPAARPEAPFWLSLAPGLSRAGSPGTTLFGFDAGVSRAFGPLAASAELQARWGQAELRAADVELRTLSGSLALAPVLAWSRVALSLGPGLRAGHAQLAAEARSAGLTGDELGGFWLGALLMATGRIELHGASALRVAFEAGHVLHGVTGQDQSGGELLALRGLWFSAAVGIAVSL